MSAKARKRTYRSAQDHWNESLSGRRAFRDSHYPGAKKTAEEFPKRNPEIYLEVNHGQHGHGRTRNLSHGFCALQIIERHQCVVLTWRNQAEDPILRLPGFSLCEHQLAHRQICDASLWKALKIIAAADPFCYVVEVERVEWFTHHIWGK